MRQDLLSTVQSNIDGVIMSIISDFTTQASTESEIACMLINFVYEMAFQVVQTALSFGIGAVPGGAGELAIEAEKIVRVGENKKQKDFHANSHWIWTGIELIHRVARMEMEIDGMKWTDEWYGANSEMEQRNYQLVMGQAYVGGLCAEVGGNMPNQNWERATKMASYVSKAFMDMRAVLERLMKAVTNGNALQKGVSYFSLYLEHDEMFNAVQRLKQGNSVYEKYFIHILPVKFLANCFQHHDPALQGIAHHRRPSQQQMLPEVCQQTRGYESPGCLQI